MRKEAVLSNDRKFRYSLSRVWDEAKGIVLFICLNPSTADEATDDPTVHKCVEFAKRWEYGGVVLGNLFALRATDPQDLYKSADPVGPENDKWLRKLIAGAEITVVAWGNDGSYMNRDTNVLRLLRAPRCLAINKTGEPRHPLYVSLKAKLQIYFQEDFKKTKSV